MCILEKIRLACISVIDAKYCFSIHDRNVKSIAGACLLHGQKLDIIIAQWLNNNALPIHLCSWL